MYGNIGIKEIKISLGMSKIKEARLLAAFLEVNTAQFLKLLRGGYQVQDFSEEQIMEIVAHWIRNNKKKELEKLRAFNMNDFVLQIDGDTGEKIETTLEDRIGCLQEVMKLEQAKLSGEIINETWIKPVAEKLAKDNEIPLPPKDTPICQEAVPYRLLCRELRKAFVALGNAETKRMRGNFERYGSLVNDEENAFTKQIIHGNPAITANSKKRNKRLSEVLEDYLSSMKDKGNVEKTIRARKIYAGCFWRYGIRRKLIAVAYHDSNNELAFRKPTEEEMQDLEKSQDSLTKCIYLNNDQELRKRMDATLGSKELSFNQKLISFITNQATSQLFQEIDQKEEPETAREIKDLISEGASRFILRNILFTKWDPRQKKAAVFRNSDQTENFPLMVEPPLQKVPQQLEASIDSTLQNFKNLFNLLGPQDLEPFMILHPRETAEPEMKKNFLKTVIIKAEDAIHWSKVEQKTQKRSMGDSSRYVEFLTDDLLAKIKKGKAETVDRPARKKIMAETFSDTKKYLKDDGILSVLCEEGRGEIVEDVQESLKEAGFEVEENREIERSGNEKGKWERVVVGRKGN